MYRKFGLIAILSTTIISSGCRVPVGDSRLDSTEFSTTTSIAEIPSSKVKYMMIAGRAGGYSADGNFHKVTNPILIKDAELIASIFASLRTALSEKGTDLMLVPARPVLFLDSQKDVLCAFLYWPASRPENMLTRVKAYRRFGSYYVGQSAEATVRSVPGLSGLVAPYVDVHK